MRYFPLPLAVLLFCPAAPAWAQVTVDLHALDALPGMTGPSLRHPVPIPRLAPRHSTATVQPTAQTPSTTVATAQPTAPAPRATVATVQPSAPAPRPTVAPTPPAAPTPRPTVVTAQPPAPAPRSTVATVQPPVSQPAARPQPPPVLTTVPAAPPAVAEIAPIQPPTPPAHTPPAAPPPIAAGAATTAAATPAGLRLSFASGQSDLSPGSADSIKRLVQAAPVGESTTFNVLAYATGEPNDPSVARRLSLTRALAVRSVLMADGVPSTRIYLRALGSEPGGGPPDRVDLSVLGANAMQQ